MGKRVLHLATGNVEPLDGDFSAMQISKIALNGDWVVNFPIPS